VGKVNYKGSSTACPGQRTFAPGFGGAARKEIQILHHGKRGKPRGKKKKKKKSQNQGVFGIAKASATEQKKGGGVVSCDDRGVIIRQSKVGGKGVH